MRARAVAVAEGNARAAAARAYDCGGWSNSSTHVHGLGSNLGSSSSSLLDRSNALSGHEHLGHVSLSLDPLDFALTFGGQPVDMELGLREQGVQAG